MRPLLACLGLFLSLQSASAQISLSAEFPTLLPQLPQLPPGLLSVPSSEDAANTGPFLADSWSGDLVQVSPGIVSKGHMYYDRLHQRTRQVITNHLSIFTQDDLQYFDSVQVNATGLNVNITIGLGADAVCKAMAMPYTDQFAVLALGHAAGSATVGGVKCEVWIFDSVPGINISACVSADGVPREVNSTAGGVTSSARIENVTVGPLDAAIFATSQVCATRYPTAACPSQGFANLSVYRIHGEEPLELSDRNVGDDLGDMAFVCAAGASAVYRTKLVSHWELTASTAWGQYAYCLFRGGKNTCFGGTGKQVGRESAMGLGNGPLQGQCSANNDVGSWYNFPGAGECAPGKAMGTDGCTWGQTVLRRTVSASCILQDRGLAQVCSEERGHAPFVRSAAIFRAALASSDPAKGGCPDVNPQIFVV